MTAYSGLPTLLLAAIYVAIINDVGAFLGQHSTQFKSIRSTYGECNKYLWTDELRLQCDTRCVALVSRIWADTPGLLSESTGRFYAQQDQGHCARDRTKQCLNEVNSTVPRRDPCKRAHESVGCYLKNYGQLNMTGLKYVPFTDIQQVRILQQCATILDIADKLERVVQNGLQAIPEGACLLRCVLIRQGLYSDGSGPDLERLSIQCNGYGDNEAEWRANVTRCVANVQASRNCDRCQQAARIATDCLEINFKLFVTKKASFKDWIPYGIRLDSAAVQAKNIAAAKGRAGARAVSASNTEVQYAAWTNYIFEDI